MCVKEKRPKRKKIVRQTKQQQNVFAFQRLFDCVFFGSKDPHGFMCICVYDFIIHTPHCCANDDYCDDCW